MCAGLPMTQEFVSTGPLKQLGSAPHRDTFLISLQDIKPEALSESRRLLSAKAILSL